ncbi:MAG: 30S ribosome-binding factor RbfA [Desulfotomaculaceae bacterium]|nr:30S ribosome-binding factor RbfA [Desulfotomaculaceae bacterium]
MSFRPERLAEAIKKEVSELLRDELRDPRIGFVSITSVDVSKDLRYANVYASVFGEPDQQKISIEVLQKAQGFIRGELGKRIRLRHTPEITFKLDHSISHGSRIIALLEKAKEKGGGLNE